MAPTATVSPAPASGITTPPSAIPPMDHFNLAALPVDVRLRLQQHTNPSLMMTQTTMLKECETITPNHLLDPTGNIMLTSLNCMGLPGSGNRLFTLNGALFSLKPQGSDGEKQFLVNVPSCSGTSTTEICNWYHVFTVHATAHGFYVQPNFFSP